MTSTFYPPYAMGGDADFVHRLTHMLARGGHEVEVIHCIDSYRALAKGPFPSGYPHDRGVALHGLRSRVGVLSPLATYLTGYPLFKGRKIRNILEAKRFDVIHFHNISLVGGPMILRYGEGIKLYTTHEHWLVCPMHVLFKFNREACMKQECLRCTLIYRRPPQLWRYTGMLKAALRHVDAFISPSEFSLRRHRSDGLDIPLVHIPPCFGQDTERGALSAARDEIRLPSRPFFLFVGRLEKLKGLHTIIPLFHDYRGADLVVAGDGNYSDHLKKLAAGNDRIHFLGRLTPLQLKGAYAQAIALLVPSIAFEVFPLVILEAYAAHTPVIVRDLGPLPEIVAQSDGGLVFRNNADLLEAMDRLQKDQALRNQFGESGYRAYCSRWTAELHLARYLGLIEEIRARKNGGTGIRMATPRREAEMERSIKGSRIPLGPPGYPLLGHLPDFLRDKLGFLSRCAAQYGDVVKLKIGKPTFLLNNPEDIKHVLVTNPENYDKTPRLTSARGKRLSGEGLLTSLGSAHLRQRRMLQPVFYRKIIEPYAETILRSTEDMLAEWRSHTELDIAQGMMKLAQEIMIRTVFGSDFKDSLGELAEAISTRRRYMEYIFFSLFPFPECLPTRIVREYRRAIKQIDGTIDRSIQARRTSGNVSNDMLSMLMGARYEDGTPMNDKQVRDEARTLLITGHETIGTALAWTWYLLAQHPETETTLLAELHEVLDGRRPGVEDLPKLRYAAMVLAESMRLYPPTWIFIRMARQEDSLPSGMTIPAGSKLYLSQYVIHRNPHYWPNPEHFDPDRFSETAKQNRPQFAYFPFGGGPRVCIGETFAKIESLLVLATIAQRFKLALVPGQSIAPEPRMILWPKNGILMRLNQR